jgi:hypothetical protein
LDPIHQVLLNYDGDRNPEDGTSGLAHAIDVILPFLMLVTLLHNLWQFRGEVAKLVNFAKGMVRGRRGSDDETGGATKIPGGTTVYYYYYYYYYYYCY